MCISKLSVTIIHVRQEYGQPQKSCVYNMLATQQTIQNNINILNQSLLQTTRQLSLFYISMDFYYEARIVYDRSNNWIVG
jgi:hypothetical protein